MKAAAALALVVALALSALAGAANAATPTKREFIRKGDALCASIARELVPIRQRAEAAKSLPQSRQWAAATSIWSDQIAIQLRFNTKFRAIGVPAGDATAGRLVSSLDRGVVLARKVRDGFARRDVNALASSLPAYLQYTLALNRRIQAYGFRVCGRA